MLTTVTIIDKYRYDMKLQKRGFMPDTEHQIKEDSENVRLSPQVPEKVLRMWYVEDKKNNYEVKKLSENKTAKAIKEWNSQSNTVVNSLGITIRLYKTFTEAAEIAILLKITEKKKKWESYVNASIVLNNEIGELYETLDKLQGAGDDDDEDVESK